VYCRAPRGTLRPPDLPRPSPPYTASTTTTTTTTSASTSRLYLATRHRTRVASTRRRASAITTVHWHHHDELGQPEIRAVARAGTIIGCAASFPDQCIRARDGTINEAEEARKSSGQNR
jgi:hypothetical protein